jgi:molybdopterin-guanine dinucleotide biosynthesis protein MobB
LKVILFLGFSDSGKTTALTSVCEAMVKMGLGRVGTIKHIHHGDPNFTVDTQGKDTWLHARSGASVVVSLSSNELAIIRRGPDVAGLGVDELLSVFRREKVDYVLVEGLYRKFARKRSALRVICASTEEQVDALLKEHGSENVLCITGKIAGSPRYRRRRSSSRRKENPSYAGLPIVRTPSDATKIVRMLALPR